MTLQLKLNAIQYSKFGDFNFINKVLNTTARANIIKQYTQGWNYRLVIDKWSTAVFSTLLFSNIDLTLLFHYRFPTLSTLVIKLKSYRLLHPFTRSSDFEQDNPDDPVTGW